MKSVVAYPDKDLESKLKNNCDVLILKDDGLFYKNQLIDNLSIVDDISKEEFNKLEAEFILGLQTFYRWNSDLSQINTSFYSYFNKLLSIYIAIKKHDVKNIIMFTMVAHHIKLDMISVISEVLQVETIYFPHSVINGKLIPVKQIGRFGKKDVVRLHNYKYDKALIDRELDLFYKDTIKGKMPKENVAYIPKFKETIFLFAFAYLNYAFLRDRTAVLIKKRKKSINYFSELSFIFNQKKYMKEYERNFISHCEFESGDIVIAAQYQPEATSFPDGYPYHNHLKIISKLRSSGFKGNIYYKEHPDAKKYYDNFIGMTKIGFYRDLSYFEYLKDNNVKVLSYDFDLNKANLPNVWVLTMTGSIGMERSLKKLPTIIAGRPWYGMPPYCLSLDDFLLNDSYETGCPKIYLTELLHNTLPIKSCKGADSKFFEEFLEYI